jgi:predicted acylesterase/phospholipase RssA
MDGGVLTKLPLLAAIERGALQLVGINIENAMGTSRSAVDLFGISSYALSLISDRQAHMEIAWAEATGAQVRVLHILAPEAVRFWDFTQAERLFDLGYRTAQEALDEEPLKLLPEWQVRLRQGVQQAVNPILKPGYIDESMEHEGAG